jgi:V/A-type H+-transporting ATPase subunit E
VSADRILDKIKQDAIQEAALIKAQGEAKAEEIRASLARKTDEQIEAVMTKTRREAEEMERRAMLMAGLESRKNTLAARRAALDEVFERALGRLASLEGERFDALIQKIVLESAESGEERLRVPAKDLERYQNGLLIKLNRALEGAGKKGGLTLDETPAAFTGGVQLIGVQSDVNGSFEALLRALREQLESEVASLLFATEVQ